MRGACIVVLALSAFGLVGCGPRSGPGVRLDPGALERDPLVGADLRPLLARSTRGSVVQLPTPGKVTLVDYWATFCVPCRTAMPRLDRWAREWGPRGLVVVGVASDDNPGLVAETLARMAISYPSVLDDHERTLARLGGVGLIPTAIVFDRRGRVRYVARGRPDQSAEPQLAALEAALPALLDEAE